MARVKKYIITFTKVAILAGVLFGLFMSLKIGLRLGIQAGIMFGITFSIIIALIFIPIDYLCTRKLPKEALKIRQNREIQVKGKFGEAFNNCYNILNRLEFIQSVIPNKDNKIISARTQKSNSSFGEDITLKFITLKVDLMKININSDPIFKWTQLDFGKNFKNIEQICKAILEISEKDKTEIKV